MNALAPVKDDWIIKGYEYVATLGEGSFAAAYRARHRKLRVDRVIKLLKSELMRSDDGEDYPALFAEEARVLALIKNENVPQVFDCGETDDGRPYFVMEFLNGKDLAAVIEDEKRTPFPVRTVLNLGICIFDGLAAAHQVGIIHRDVKPANIFIVRPDQPGGSPKAKVIDFGTFSPNGKTEKRDGKVVCRGTARYAPPEQFSGQPLTTAADIYAVGVVLHEMITGLFPFSWLTNSDKLAEAHATRPLRPIDTVRSDVPAAVIHLVDWFLQKDLTKRPSSAELCARKLRDLKDELDLTATVSRAATGRSIVVEDGAGRGEAPSVDPAATARFRSETKELEPGGVRKPIDNKTDVDPVWWEGWIAEQAAKAGLSREPETFIAQSVEDQALLIDLNRIEPQEEPASATHTAPTAERELQPSIHTDPTRTVPIAAARETQQVPKEVVTPTNVPATPRDIATPRLAENTTSLGLGPVASNLEVAISAASADDSSENIFVDSPADAAAEETVRKGGTRPAASTASSLAPRAAPAEPVGRRSRPWPVVFALVVLGLAIMIIVLALFRHPLRAGDLLPLPGPPRVLPAPAPSVAQPLSARAPGLELSSGASSMPALNANASGPVAADASAKPKAPTAPTPKKPARTPPVSPTPAPSARAADVDDLNTTLRESR